MDTSKVLSDILVGGLETPVYLVINRASFINHRNLWVKSTIRIRPLPVKGFIWRLNFDPLVSLPNKLTDID